MWIIDLLNRCIIHITMGIQFGDIICGYKDSYRLKFGGGLATKVGNYRMIIRY